MTVKHSNEIINILNQLGGGIHSCGKGEGWIGVEVVNDGFDVMWTSHKNHHDPTSGTKAVLIYYRDKQAHQVFESILSMWPVYIKTKRATWINWLSKQIRKAFHERQSQKKK